MSKPIHCIGNKKLATAGNLEVRFYRVNFETLSSPHFLQANNNFKVKNRLNYAVFDVSTSKTKDR